MGNTSGQLGSSTTADQALAAAVAAGADVSGKVAIVTGGNTGIGLEAARTLAANKCRVIIACRDPKKGQDAVEDLKKTPGVDAANVEAMQLDLADLDSVRAFADSFEKKNLPLHLLINNAGIMNTPYGKTKQGFEQQFGVNHLAHFLLTELLLPKLKSSAPARIVNVSSSAHRMDPKSIHTIYDDINLEKKYSSWSAYSRSKLANVLFSNALNRKLAGSGVTSYALHPGVIYTGLWQHTSGGSIFGVLGRPFLKSGQQGAATTIYCATWPNLEGGKFFEDCHEGTPNPKALDVKIQDDLWDISRKLVGLTDE
eukprot:TRINITY_DN3801_c0_g1_i1.p1 TRINITY_DN3801_c0_g1~~TRINITY_DN3801_c0_g1_i1.p1  ORF type:complete len:319 (+),score=63.80 TRINITY_DN3801_c0_g1_i1:23-958(+)